MKNSSKQSVKMDMLHGSLFDKMLMFAMPLAACSILQQLFNSVGTAVVGRFASSEALAAVGSNSSVIALMVTLFSGISLGCNVVIANYIGQNDTKRIPRVVHTAVSLALLSGVFLLILGQFVAHPILLLMGAPKDIIHLATLYLRIYFLGMPFFMLYDFGASILRSIGDTRRPMYALIVSGVVNVILNLLFVVVFHMGVAGAGLATVGANATSAVQILYFLTHEELPIRLSFKSLTIDRDSVSKILKIGVPAGLQGMVFSLANVCIQSGINSFGAGGIAGSAVELNYEYFAYYLVNAFAQTVVTFTGQNYGAGKPERIWMGVKVSALMMIIYWAFTFCILMLGARTFALLFVEASELEILKDTELFLHISVSFFPVLGLLCILRYTIQGAGYTNLAMLSGVSEMIARVLVSLYAVPAFGYLAVCFGDPTAWIAAVLFLVPAFIFVYRRLLRMRREQ